MSEVEAGVASCGIIRLRSVSMVGIDVEAVEIEETSEGVSYTGDRESKETWP